MKMRIVATEVVGHSLRGKVWYASAVYPDHWCDAAEADAKKIALHLEPALAFLYMTKWIECSNGLRMAYVLTLEECET